MQPARLWPGRVQAGWAQRPVLTKPEWWCREIGPFAEAVLTSEELELVAAMEGRLGRLARYRLPSFLSVHCRNCCFTF